MQTLEVTLRNALNESVKTCHDGKYQADDWWFEHLVTDVQDQKISRMSPQQKGKWIDLGTGRRKKKNHQEQQLKRTIVDLKREGRTPVIHDDVIGRQVLGFWTTFLGKGFEDVTTKKLLWPNLLKDVFPNTPHKPKRAEIEARLKSIKDLRNRISHHEPVWKFYKPLPSGAPDYKTPVYGLNPSLLLVERQYNEILELIRWMSEDRYQSFIYARLDIEFRKLCSHDGFYAYVDSNKIKNVARCARAKREAKKIWRSAQNGVVTAVTRNGKPITVVGINEPF